GWNFEIDFVHEDGQLSASPASRMSEAQAPLVMDVSSDFHWISKKCFFAGLCFGLLLCRAALADTLFFKASLDEMGNINYNWLSPSNWYQPDGSGGLMHVGRPPVSGDNAVVLSTANAAGNGISLVSMIMEPGVAINGGNFSV